MTGSWSEGLSKKNRYKAESSSPIPRRRNRRKARSLPLERASAWKMAAWFRSTLRRAIVSCSASTPGATSRWMARSTSSCAKTRCLAYWRVHPSRKKQLREVRYGSETGSLQRKLTAGNSARCQPTRRRGEGHTGSEGSERRPGKEVRWSNDHQGWRHRRQGSGTEGSSGEHGCPDGTGGGLEDIGHSR